MLTPLDIAKAIGGPGSIGFLIAASVVGAVLLLWVPRGRVPGRVWLVTLYAGYLLLALAPVARAIAAPFANPLAGQQPVVGGIDTLIVFDGDNWRARIRETVRVWAVARPRTVIASAEPWFVKRLLDAGIPRERIVHESQSRNTQDQITFVSAYASVHPRERLAVITSRLQAPRVAALFDRAGVTVPLFDAPVDQELPERGVWRLAPTYTALCISRDALYERVALAYYRSRHWIDP